MKEVDLRRHLSEFKAQHCFPPENFHILKPPSPNTMDRDFIEKKGEVWSS